MNVPDMYDMWKAHDDEQNRQLEKLPLCADCEEPIQTESAYYIHGEWICESCMESYRKDIYI